MNISFNKDRLTNITATDMAILFALNPYESPASIIKRKTNPENITSPAMRRGILFEPAVLEALRIDINMETVRNTHGTCVMKDHRIAATPDAFLKEFYNENLTNQVVIEAKSVGSQQFERWYTLVPHYYHMQVHTQIAVLEAQYGYIAALESSGEDCEYRLVVWKILRHEELEEMMKKEVKRFWENYDNGNLFRANSEMKKRALAILETTASRVYPEKLEETDDTYEKIRSIFT